MTSLAKRTVPGGFELREIRLITHEGEIPAMAAIKTWSSKDAFFRGFKKGAKLVAIVVGASLPFAFLEPFAFMVWGSIVIALAFLVVGPVVHLMIWREQVSFFFVKGVCPQCSEQGDLIPYLSTAFAAEFTVLCPKCGQTTRCKQV